MKIVILDDSPTIQLSIIALLEELGIDASEMASFSSGFDALDYIRAEGADIIFSDIHMPLMDGWQFAEQLYGISPSMINRLFVISGEGDHQYKARMKAIGARRFIPKPIDAERFKHFVLPVITKIRAG